MHHCCWKPVAVLMTQRLLIIQSTRKRIFCFFWTQEWWKMEGHIKLLGQGGKVKGVWCCCCSTFKNIWNHFMFVSSTYYFATSSQASEKIIHFQCPQKFSQHTEETMQCSFCKQAHKAMHCSAALLRGRVFQFTRYKPSQTHSSSLAFFYSKDMFVALLMTRTTKSLLACFKSPLNHVTCWLE